MEVGEAEPAAEAALCCGARRMVQNLQIANSINIRCENNRQQSKEITVMKNRANFMLTSLPDERREEDAEPATRAAGPVVSRHPSLSRRPNHHLGLGNSLSSPVGPDTGTPSQAGTAWQLDEERHDSSQTPMPSRH